MTSAVILKTKESDANLVICIWMITSLAEYCIRRDIQLLVDFPAAPFTVSYLVNRLIVIDITEMRGEQIEILKTIDLNCGSSEPTNKSMIESMKEKFTGRQSNCSQSTCNPFFGWVSVAAKAFGKKSMMIITEKCCSCDISGTTLGGIIKNLEGVSSVPLYVDPFSFSTPCITDRTVNSVKSFASLVSLCFLYVGPNCIHTQIAALMGVPVFVFGENLDDNRFSVAITTKEFKTAHSVLDARNGSSIFPKAHKFWSAYDRSFS